MFISDRWEDFQLLDCSGGEKLERWGEYILRRPDPQAIWQTPKENPYWDCPNAVYHRSSRGGGRWEINNLPKSWQVDYGDLTFNIKPMNFKHTGIFPEQGDNWDFIRETIIQSGRDVSVLNLFAYTGAATVAAASAGAQVCHVDAAKGMVNWAKENAQSSGLGDAPIRWIVDDCAKFVTREIKRGRRYDAIIMDPPSYGRGPSGEVWRLEDNLWDFVSLCCEALSDEPLFVLISSYTTGLSPRVMGNISESIFSKNFGGKTDSDELGLLAADSGLLLPCGAASRWTAG